MQSYIIIIFALFLVVEVQQILCGEDNDEGTVDSDESDDSKDESLPQDYSVSITRTSTKNGRPVVPGGVITNQGELKANVDEEVLKKATADYEAAVKKAESTLREANSKVEGARARIEAELGEALKTVGDKFDRQSVIALVIWRKAFQKRNEYERAKSLAMEKYRAAEQDIHLALEAADDKFLAAYSQLEEKKRKIEEEHREELEKGRAAQTAALKLAGEMKAKAENEYRAARKRKGVASPEATAKYYAEMEKYDEALEVAEKEWQKVLEKVGLGREYEEAVQKAVAELQESQNRMWPLLSEAREQYQGTVLRLDETNNAAKGSASKEENEAKRRYKDALRSINLEREEMSSRMQRKWKKAFARINAAAGKAKNDFQNAVAEAKRVYDETLGKTNEMQSLTWGNNRPKSFASRRRIIVTNV